MTPSEKNKCFSGIGIIWPMFSHDVTDQVMPSRIYYHMRVRLGTDTMKTIAIHHASIELHQLCKTLKWKRLHRTRYIHWLGNVGLGGGQKHWEHLQGWNWETLLCATKKGTFWNKNRIFCEYLAGQQASAEREKLLIFLDTKGIKGQRESTGVWY